MVINEILFEKFKIQNNNNVKVNIKVPLGFIEFIRNSPNGFNIVNREIKYVIGFAILKETKNKYNRVEYKNTLKNLIQRPIKNILSDLKKP